MAASDPTTDVPTPTGTLQGVAAFSWDGSAWQPAGRAGPSVATPTGVLRGVAAFNGGPAWQPSGRAQPGVATPSGTLDGVAVYTWSGAAWTPPGGQPTPSTPNGALRGVAAFNWDGFAWQPAGQAGPSVATPYGVLDGVAMFNWSGSAWAAVGAPSLSLGFMTPGTLDPRLTFTRASTATYTDASGTVQTAAANVPRWGYSNGVLQGLLLEDARTNLWLQSADASNAAWVKLGTTSAAPVVTANQTTAPDGTLTAARVVYPAVSVGGAQSLLYQLPTMTAVQYAFSVYMKGAIGGEQLYLGANSGGSGYFRTRVTLTTSWQRFTLTGTATAAGWVFDIGTDLTDASQSSTAAQTIYVWGAQVEQGFPASGGFATSYIPTAAAAVTRAIDSCLISSANMVPWFAPPGGSWYVEFIAFDSSPFNTRVIGQPNVFGSICQAFLTATQFGQFDGAAAVYTANAPAANVVLKTASNWTAGRAAVCLNGGAVGSAATLTTGYGAFTASGVRFMTPNSSNSTDNTNGYLRNIRYWPRTLADAEMQSVTT